ncbi:unnamed protein product [Staurois parvus]|uniref:Uncharacterized protein n=1 Tax=Staurois parvus TaxID=386267 RepID=A0ABN9CK24_9NEOB|nr:unnamed protein product [Staurois parvus]
MYVKWFDTVMLYYAILVYLVNVAFNIFESPAIPSPYVPYLPTLTGSPEDGCRHRSEEMARDAAGGTLRERRTR